MTDHDVLIVGAGPVGLLLGCLLAQRDVDVVICERRADADARTRAIGIHRPGLDALEAAGVGAAVRAEALALDGGEVRSRGRTLAALDFAADRPVLVLSQQRTDALLRERLDALSVEALRPAHVVRGVRDEGDFARTAVDAGHGVREITAGLVVAADGVRSGVREQLGIPWRAHSGGGRYVMLDAADPAAGSRAGLHCEPDGLVESFPMPGGRRRWVIRADDPDKLLTAASFRAEIERRTGIRPTIVEDAAPVTFLAAQHTASALVHGRVVLLGDAAHEVSPIGGQGMNLGWSAAVRLAEEILRGLARGRPPELDGYERRTRAAARAAQRRSGFYMAMGTAASGLPLAAREVLIRGLGAPPLRRWTSGLITMRGT